MMYDDPEQEARSIMAWTDRRLEWCGTSGMVSMYVKTFKHMWYESFGTLDNIPQDYKDKITARYNELKVRETA